MASSPTKAVKISKDLHRQLTAIQRRAKQAKRRVPDLSEMVDEAVSTRMGHLTRTYAGGNDHQA